MSRVMIGIAAKNEEKTIYNCLLSIVEATNLLPSKPDIFVCLNNCSDRTEEEIFRFIANTNYSLRIGYSSGNLIDAQRKIFSYARGQTVVFIDADVLVEKGSIKKLLDGLNDRVRLTYAKSIIAPPKSNCSLPERVFRLYTKQTLLTQRQYFHGRFFATKDWSFPSRIEIKKRAQSAAHLLLYGDGFVADDIYLSAFLIYRFGPNSIKEIKSARVYTSPIKSWRDWWATYRRIKIELEKLFKWYPEFESISSLLYRKTNWSSFFRAPLYEKCLWMIYLLAKILFSLMVSIELLAIKYLRIYPHSQWRSVNSTKTIINKRKLILFDIDGTLVDGSSSYYLSNKFKNSIRHLMNQGNQVGLATHRSQEGSVSIYENLNLNGPLIVEGGARIFIPRKGKLQEVFLGKERYRVNEIVTSQINKYFHIKMINGSILSKNDELTSLAKSRITIRVNKERRNSSSIYVYYHGKPSTRQAQNLMSYLQTQIYKFGLKCEVSKDMPGKLHIFFGDIDKVSAIQSVRNVYYSNDRTFLIGDNETMQLVPGVELLGVQNANPMYQLLCQFVASKTGTRGLLEIIQSIK